MLIFLLFSCFLVFYRAKIGTFAFDKAHDIMQLGDGCAIAGNYRNWLRK